MTKRKTINKSINLKLIIFFVIIFSVGLIIILNLKLKNQNVNNTENKVLNFVQSEDIIEQDTQTISNANFTVNVEDYIIKAYQIEGIYYFFLPKNVDISNLIINYDIDIKSATIGNIDIISKDLINDFTQNDEIILTAQDDTQYVIKVIKSDIPCVCINLLNNETLEQINKGHKDEKYVAELQVMGASEEKYNIKNKIIEIKGRGNSTWEHEKKPYQIKFEEKEKLLGLNGKSKKWILLANYSDISLMKNQLSFDLQKEIGLSNSIKGMFVDIYINGEFLGNYTLCDKIDIGEERVNLSDSRGIIAEMDLAYNLKEEYKFSSKVSKTEFVIKESISEEGSEEHTIAMKEFEQAINKFETLIYAENPNWEEISRLIDVESFLKYYFLVELAEDSDRFITSTFFYKDGPNDAIHIGPIWDSDLSFGYFIENGVNSEVDYTLNFKKYKEMFKNDWYNQLYRNKEFVQLLNKMYQETIKPVYNNVSNILDSYINNMTNSIEMNLIRWKIDMEKYQEAVNDLKKFLQDRVGYLNKRYSIDDEVLYTTYTETEKWESTWKKNGQISGSEGQGIGLVDIKITLANSEQNQNIKYDVYIQDKGWTGWHKNGNNLKTEGKGKNIQAIKIDLEGMQEYIVKYRTYVQKIGWQEWKQDGELAGTTESDLGIEAIQIRLLKN